MAGFTLKIEGLQAAIIALKKVEGNTIKKLENELDGFATKVKNEAVRRAPLYDGQLKNSIGAVRKGLKVDVVAAKYYAAYVEFGTKKFAAAYVATLPPDWKAYAATFKGEKGKGGGSMDDFIKRMVEWVKKKGIGAAYDIKTRKRDKFGAKKMSNADMDYNTAYAIVIRILQNGIKAQPFLYPAFEIARKELVANLLKGPK